jgi:hypothetical protein
MRPRDRCDGACIVGYRKRPAARRYGNRAAAMDMHMPAGLIRRRGIAVLLRLVDRDMVFVEVDAMIVVRRMAVDAVMPMSMDVEGRQDRRIAVHAADAKGGSNEKKAQNLASQKAHTQEKPKDSNAVKTNPDHFWRCRPTRS